MKIGLPKDGRFGDFGGKYIPETLVPAIEELEENYQKFKNDKSFQKEFDYYLKNYAGRPTPLYFAENLTKIVGGAKALSILTQPYLFNGSPEYFIKIRKNVEIPLLMKDIMINKIQIDAAKKMGADYFLLIQALFDNGFVNEIDEFIDYGHKNGLKILLESHSKTEFDNAMKTNADMIGINNRNLDTLEINLETTKQILENSQKSKIILSESGINSSDDVKFLRDCGADAFLIGTSIMKSSDIQNSVSKLVSAI